MSRFTIKQENMKKFYLFLFVAVAAIGILTSCSQEESFVATQSETTKSQVLADLEALNLSIINDSQASNSLKKAKKNWNELTTAQKWKVVAADGFGALSGGKTGAERGTKMGKGLGSPITGGTFGAAVGAIAGGAWASWKAWPNVCSCGTQQGIPSRAPSVSLSNNNGDFNTVLRATTLVVNSDLSVNNNSVTITDQDAVMNLNLSDGIIQKSNLDEISLHVGKIHNIILSVLDGSVVLNEDEQTVNDAVESFLADEDFTNSIESIAEMTINGECLDDNGIASQVFKLFEQILEEYSCYTDDIAFVIGKYNEIIDKTTELNEAEKKSLKCGLATALYSSKYWENK